MYRFVHSAMIGSDSLEDDFQSDREAGKSARGLRVQEFPELFDGLSAFASLEAARRRWKDMAQLAAERGEPVRVGDYVAEVHLRPDEGCDVEDLGLLSEHLTIWGPRTVLAAAVAGIYQASTEED